MGVVNAGVDNADCDAFAKVTLRVELVDASHDMGRKEVLDPGRVVAGHGLNIDRLGGRVEVDGTNRLKKT